MILWPLLRAYQHPKSFQTAKYVLASLSLSKDVNRSVSCTTVFQLAEEKHGWFSVFQEKWRRLVAEGTTNIEMFDQVILMTLDSLLKCAFSYNSNCQQWALHLYSIPQIYPRPSRSSISLNIFSLQVNQWVRVSHRGAERPDNRSPPKDFTPLWLDLLENGAGETIQKGVKHCAQVPAEKKYSNFVTKIIK